MASAGFLFILRESWRTSAETTSIFSQLMFRAVHWAARRGLRQEERFSSEAKKPEARHSQGNVCLLVFAEAGLRFRGTEYAPRGVKGEIDLVGYNDKTLAFVEARTRTVSEDLPALPELSVTGKNNVWWFARRSGFWRNVMSVSVPAASTLWRLVTAPASPVWCECTRMPSALKYDALGGTSSQKLQTRYNSKSPGCPTPRG